MLRPMYLLWDKLVEITLAMLCCGRKKGRLEGTRPVARPSSGRERSEPVQSKEARPGSERTGGRESGGREGTRQVTGGSRTNHGRLEMGIKTLEMEDDDTVMQTVEILKRPGQTLGFYIREGNGVDKHEGVFISRIAPGSVVENNGLLRIGDEIISVNSVDVTNMNLDDVVILLSIPKRLVLNIRTRRTCCKNASCPSLSTMEGEEPPPVVVLKKGRSSSATAVEMTEKCPDEVLLAGDPRGYYKGMGYGGHVPYPGIGAASGGYSHYIHPAALMGQGRPGDDSELLHPGEPGDHKQSPKLSPREHTVTFRSPRMGRRSTPRGYPLDYSSDTDACYSHERAALQSAEMSHRYLPRNYDPSAVKAFQDEIERTHHKYEAFVNTRHKYSKAGRSLSPERYNSDSEIVNYRMREKSLPPREPMISHLLDVDDRCNSLPQMDVGESSEELKHWLRKFDNLSFDTTGQDEALQSVPTDVMGYSTAPRAPKTGDGRESYTSEEYWSYRHGPSYPQPHTSMHKPTQHVPAEATLPRSGRGPRPRVTRKLSADSLLDYRTYQLEDHDLHQGQDLPGRAPKVSHMYGPGSAGTMTLSRSRQSMSSVSDSESKSVSRMKDLQLARKPLQIRTEDFKFYQPDLDDRKAKFEKAMVGSLAVHIYCGHGLKSSRTVLRDLYCVVEVDSVNKARTMIRTGAINFDWDEGFEIDLESAKEMSFLIYSWDPNTRHRLCFSSTVGLQAFFATHTGQHKIALKLEPKGIMYLGLEYRSPGVTLHRTPSMRKGAMFGVDLETIILREKTGLKVPLLLKRCIEEVERRGLDHIGIYRLCGSARRKAQLKEDFSRNPKVVDLSQDSVSDINVITGVIKDFLRELPEPLFTDALYQMLLDALSVRLPGDPDGSAKLMLSILECLPKANQETLAYLLDHLKRVAVKCEVNKMTTQNLAVCFGPVLLCPAPTGNEQDIAMEFKKHIEVLRYLLDIWPENRGVGDKNACHATSTDGPTTTTTSSTQRSHDQTSVNLRHGATSSSAAPMLRQRSGHELLQKGAQGQLYHQDSVKGERSVDLPEGTLEFYKPRYQLIQHNSRSGERAKMQNQIQRLSKSLDRGASTSGQFFSTKDLQETDPKVTQYIIEHMPPKMFNKHYKTLTKLAERSQILSQLEHQARVKDRVMKQHDYGYTEDNYSSPDSQRSHISAGFSSSDGHGSMSASASQESEGQTTSDRSRSRTRYRSADRSRTPSRGFKPDDSDLPYQRENMNSIDGQTTRQGQRPRSRSRQRKLPESPMMRHKDFNLVIDQQGSKDEGRRTKNEKQSSGDHRRSRSRSRRASLYDNVDHDLTNIKSDNAQPERYPVDHWNIEPQKTRSRSDSLPRRTARRARSSSVGRERTRLDEYDTYWDRTGRSHDMYGRSTDPARRYNMSDLALYPASYDDSNSLYSSKKYWSRGTDEVPCGQQDLATSYKSGKNYSSGRDTAVERDLWHYERSEPSSRDKHSSPSKSTCKKSSDDLLLTQAEKRRSWPIDQTLSDLPRSSNRNARHAEHFSSYPDKNGIPTESNHSYRQGHSSSDSRPFGKSHRSHGSHSQYYDDERDDQWTSVSDQGPVHHHQPRRRLPTDPWSYDPRYGDGDYYSGSHRQSRHQERRADSRSRRDDWSPPDTDADALFYADRSSRQRKSSRSRQRSKSSDRSRSSRSAARTERSEESRMRSRSLGRDHIRRAVTFTDPPTQPPAAKSYDDSQLKMTYFYTKL